MSTSRPLAALGLAAALAAGCSSGAPSAPQASKPPADPGSPALVTGIALPQKISALPPKDGAAQAASAVAGARSSWAVAARALTAAPAGSDEAALKAVKWVDERALNQFDILNQIFKAVAQTHYADPGSVNQGTYAAMVSSPGGDHDQQKNLDRWTVQSTMEQENGRDVNVIRVWFFASGDDPPKNVRVLMKVFAAPTQLADGKYGDFGVWTLVAQFDDAGTSYFAASAERAADGSSVVKVHDHGNATREVSGILHKSGSSGYGKVIYPDESHCNTPECVGTPVTVAYVYDDQHVMLRQEGGATLFKDRSSTVDLVQRYAVFDAATGEDVARKHTFGFPIQFTTASGHAAYGYYGAWQGQHQVWANGQALPAGTVVTRADRRSGAGPASYTTSKVFDGVLTRRTRVPANVQDVRGVPLQAFQFATFTLMGNGTGWDRCDDVLWGGQNGGMVPTCRTALAPVTDLSQFQSDPAQQRNVNLFVPGGLSIPSGSASFDPMRNTFLDGAGNPIPPQAGLALNVNVNGPVWIVFDGTAWVQKKVVSVDQRTMQPTFAPADQDQPYTLPLDVEYPLNLMGVNYVVKRTAAGFVAQIELQSRANPVNLAAFVPAGTVFTQHVWGPGSTPSTFRLVTDPADPAYMKLVFVTAGSQDGGAQPGQPVSSSQWGLTATIDGQAAQFSWDYPQQAQDGFGRQQFLMDGGSYVILDEPLRFAALPLVNGAGEQRSYVLQFDGNWMSGLPDLYEDMSNSGWVVTPAIQAKAVAIPDGTEVADAVDPSKRYVVRQAEISEYLAVIADPGGLDLTPALSLDAATVPGFSPTGLAAQPPDATLRYVEGAAVP